MKIYRNGVLQIGGKEIVPNLVNDRVNILSRIKTLSFRILPKKKSPGQGGFSDKLNHVYNANSTWVI